METYEERMAEHVASLSATLEQEQAAVVELRAQLQEREGNCERLRTAIHHLTGEKPKRKERKPRRSEAGVSTGFGISLERVRPIHDKILELAANNGGRITQKDVYRPLDMDQGTASSGFQYLRSIGFLRLAGRDTDSKRDLWAVMDRDAFEQVWKDTFDRDLDAEKEALRERLANPDGSKPEDRLDLVAAYIRENGEVRGWNTVADDLGLPKHSVQDLKRTLVNAGVITVDGAQGRPAIIQWVGGETSIKEVLNGTA